MSTLPYRVGQSNLDFRALYEVLLLDGSGTQLYHSGWHSLRGEEVLVKENNLGVIQESQLAHAREFDMEWPRLGKFMSGRKGVVQHAPGS